MNVLLVYIVYCLILNKGASAKGFTKHSDYLRDLIKNDDINNLKDPYIGTLSKLKNEPINIDNALKITGFIATVEKPKNLKIAGTEEKVSIDLFVNGRLRERDILRHLPDFSTRYISSYLYGQIHFNELDGDQIDRFGTSLYTTVYS